MTCCLLACQAELPWQSGRGKGRRTGRDKMTLMTRPFAGPACCQSRQTSRRADSGSPSWCLSPCWQSTLRSCLVKTMQTQRFIPSGFREDIYHRLAGGRYSFLAILTFVPRSSGGPDERTPMPILRDRQRASCTERLFLLNSNSLVHQMALELLP